jgi:hypothetical protein
MELASSDAFLKWAKQHGVGLHPKYPELLAFVPEKGDSRFWPTPFGAQELLAFMLILLDALDPWQSCWVYKRTGAWTFAAAEGADAHDQAQDIVTRWLGIPQGYQGSVRFDEEDRARLVTLLVVQELFGWNVEHDFYFVPDHGQQFMWLDHEDALWVFFADTGRVEPFVQRMASFGYELPKEPPSPIVWQHWMGPEPADWKRAWQREAQS